AIAPHAPADLGRRLALGEATSPGREEAVAAELMELGQDRHHRVVGRLEREVVEVAPRGVRQGRGPPPDLEASLAKEQCVEARDRLVPAQPLGVERLEPRAGLRVEAPYSDRSGGRASAGNR